MSFYASRDKRFSNTDLIWSAEAPIERILTMFLKVSSPSETIMKWSQLIAVWTIKMMSVTNGLKDSFALTEKRFYKVSKAGIWRADDVSLANDCLMKGNTPENLCASF